MMRFALQRRGTIACASAPTLPVMRSAAWRPAVAAAAAAPAQPASPCCCRCLHTAAPRHNSPRSSPAVHFPPVSIAVGLAAQKQQDNPIRIMAEQTTTAATTAAGSASASATVSLTRQETASQWERETAALLSSFTHPADCPALSSSFTALHGLDADARSDPALRNRHTLKAYGRILSIRKQLDELIAARVAQQGERDRLLHDRAAERRQDRAHRRAIVRLGDRATLEERRALYREEKAQEQRLPLGASALDGAQEDERLTRLLAEDDGDFGSLAEGAYPSAVPALPGAFGASHHAAVQALQTSFESALVTLLHCLLWDLRSGRNSAHETQETIHKTPWSSPMDPLLRRFQLLQPLETLRRFSTENRSADRAGLMTSWLWREYICTQITRSEECLTRQLDEYERWAQGRAAARALGKRSHASAPFNPQSMPLHFQKENPHFPLLGPRETTILLRLLNCAPDLEASLQVHQFILRTQRVMAQAIDRAKRIDVETGLSGAGRLSEVRFESLPPFVSCLSNQFEPAMVDHYGVLIDACGKARPFADESRAQALFVEYSARMDPVRMADLFDRDSLVYIQTSLLRVSAAAGDWRRAMYLLKHSIRQPTVIHVSLVFTAVVRAFRRPPMQARSKTDGADDDLALLADSPADFAADPNARILPVDTRIENPTLADYAARDADAFFGARIALRLAATVEARFLHQRDSQGVPYASPRWERFFPDSHYYTLLLRLFGSVGDLNGCLYLMEQLLRGDAPGARNLRVGERFFSVLIHTIVAIMRQSKLTQRQRTLAASNAPPAIEQANSEAEHTLLPAESNLTLDPAVDSLDATAATQEAGSEDQQTDVGDALMLTDELDPLSSFSDDDDSDGSADDHHLASDDLAGFTPLAPVSATGALYSPAQLFEMAQRVEQVMSAPPFCVQPAELTLQAMLCLHQAAPRIQPSGAAQGSVPAVTQLWEHLLSTGVRPTRQSFDRYLRALLAAREYPRALELMESMCLQRPSTAEPKTVVHFLAQTQRQITKVLSEQETAVGAAHQSTARGQTVSDYERSTALAEMVAQNQAWVKDVLQRLLPIYEHAHTWPTASKHSAELARLLLACFAAARDHKRCLTLFQVMQPRVTAASAAAGPSTTHRKPVTRAPWPSLRIRDLLSQSTQNTGMCNAALWACVQAVHYPDGLRMWQMMQLAPSCANRLSYCLWIQLLVASMRPLTEIQAAYDAMMRLPQVGGSDSRAANPSALDPFARGVDRPRLDDFNQWIRSAWRSFAHDPNASQQREALVLWLYRTAQKDCPHIVAHFPPSTLQIAWHAAHASKQLGPSHAFTLEVEATLRARTTELEMQDEARHEARERRWESLASEFNRPASAADDEERQLQA